jgi:hypothetical protein
VPSSHLGGVKFTPGTNLTIKKLAYFAAHLAVKYGKGGTEVALKTNYFSLTSTPNWMFYQYR